jgi:hypothetical protein
VLGYPANADELALGCSADDMHSLEMTTTRVMASELVARARRQLLAGRDHRLPPSAVADAIPGEEAAQRAPDIRISVGRWSHASMADDSPQQLLAAGASRASSTLTETGNTWPGRRTSEPAVGHAVPAA